MTADFRPARMLPTFEADEKGDDMKVYTRTGDEGKTSLVGGKRVGKATPRLEAYGTVDELNSLIGLLLTYVEDAPARECLLGMQQRLFHVSANLATPPECSDRMKSLPAGIVSDIEKQIDLAGEGLPRLHSFIVPGGCRAAALAHVARTVCRRAERRIWAMVESEQIEPDRVMLAYVNRISDYLYVLARRLNFLAGEVEINVV